MCEMSNMSVIFFIAEVVEVLPIKPLTLLTQNYNSSLPRIMSNVMIMIAHNNNGNDKWKIF